MAMVASKSQAVAASRRVYIHFFDRELLSTLGIYEVTSDAVVFDDLTVLLLSTSEPLYFSASLAFENRFARTAVVRYPNLFRGGHIILLMKEYGFEEFIYTKQGQYGYTKEGYVFYFDNTWKDVAAINPAVIHRTKDTTVYLETEIITEIQGEGIENTRRRLWIPCDEKEVRRLSPYVEEAIYERREKAITKRLFTNAYEKQKASSHVEKLFNTKISESYVRSYIEECDGTISTGIRSAVDYFSYLCPTYPYHHLPIWRMIYQKMGCQPLFRTLKDGDFVVVRESVQFIRFVEAIRQYIEYVIRTQENGTISKGEGSLIRHLLAYIPTPVKAPVEYHEFLLLLDVATSRITEVIDIEEISKRTWERCIMKQKVFVVYGRDTNKRKALFDLLRAADLQPMEWEQIVALTGKGSPYVGEVLDKGLEVAQAVVVLFTGDDLAQINPSLVAEGDEEEALTPQPRPNVILEAGMALGKDQERTIIVQVGGLRKISDLEGRHVVYLANTVETRKKLLQRLETAGCRVNLRGDDWMTAGDI